nr:hypothetical protein [Nitrosomonas sp. Nm33]
MSSRSFGRLVMDLESLQEAVTLYISRAAEKLRQQHSYASLVYVYIRTSPFNKKKAYYSNSLTTPLPSPELQSNLVYRELSGCLFLIS